MHALEARLAKLRSAVANVDQSAEKELNSLLTDHVTTHLDMLLLAELPVEAGTDVLIIDTLPTWTQLELCQGSMEVLLWRSHAT